MGFLRYKENSFRVFIAVGTLWQTPWCVLATTLIGQNFKDMAFYPQSYNPLIALGKAVIKTGCYLGVGGASYLLPHAIDAVKPIVGRIGGYTCYKVAASYMPYAEMWRD